MEDGGWNTGPAAFYHLQSSIFNPRFPSAAEQPREREIQNQVQERIVEFRGMHPGAVGFVVGGKVNCPRQIAGAPIAAAVQQTAEAPEHTAEGDAGRKDVRDFPDGQSFPREIGDARDHRADQPAVIDESAMLNHEDFGERLVGKFLFPIRRHINDAGADDAAAHQPHGHVGDDFAGDIDQSRAARGRPESGEERQRHHHAIPADGQGTEMKGNRMHGGKLERRNGN